MRLRRRTLLAILASAALAAGGCGDVVNPPNPLAGPPLDHVVVYTWPGYVQVGDTLRVDAQGFDSTGWGFTGSIRSSVWRADPSSIVALEPPATTPHPSFPARFARGVAPGIAVVRATLNGVVGSDTVEVLPRLRAIEILPAAVTLRVGDTLTLQARVWPEEGEELHGRWLNWTSSDWNRAGFHLVPGRVIARQPGEVYIEAELARKVGVAHVTILPPE